MLTVSFRPDCDTASGILYNRNSATASHAPRDARDFGG